MLHALIEFLDSRLGEHGGSVPELMYHCPFCAGRKGTVSNNRKLGVNAETGKARCWRCDFRAGSADFLMRAVAKIEGERLDKDMLAAVAAGTSDVMLDSYDPRTEVVLRLYPELAVRTLTRVPLPDEFVPIEQCRKKGMLLGVNYLKLRGAKIEDAIKMRVGYCDTGRYANRLVFPVYMDGVQVYHTNRQCVDLHPAKTINPKGAPGSYRAGDVLLNYDNVIGSEVVAVVEGPFSCMSMVDTNVATLGKHITVRQVNLLSKLVERGTREIVVIRDPDAVGYDTWQQIVGVCPRVSQLVLPRGDADPWDLRHQIRKMLSRRKTPDVTSHVREILGDMVA